MLKTTCKGKDLLFELDKAVDEGWLSRSKHKTLPLSIYCYSNNTQYEGHWTDITKFARGVVVDNNGNVVTCVTPKFFNWGERNAPHPPKFKDYLAFEKVDGSMLNLTTYEGKLLGTTKASFDNEYIDFGMRYVLDNKCIGPHMSTENSYMTEVVLPRELDGMRRAVEHEPGVYFLGATHTETRKDLNPTMFYGLWEGPFPQMYKNSIDELLQDSNNMEGTEGWVIRYSNGMRFKIKTVWYLRLFRLISNLDNNVKDQILAGMSLDEILLDVPEELTEEIKTLWSSIMELVYDTEAQAVKTYHRIMHSKKPSNRKAFAQEVSKDPLKPYLFKLLDEKDIRPMIIKAVINGEIS